jgi:prolyl-tRNA editing enzyme YbaK/EbsC (Cys-tRNA(Pro) deacylase)
VYVEAGDHEMLLRMSREQFRDMMRDVRHGRFCKPIIH